MSWPKINAQFLWKTKSAIHPIGIVSASPTEAAKGDVIITARAHRTSLTIEPRKPLSSRKRSVFRSGHRNCWNSIALEMVRKHSNIQYLDICDVQNGQQCAKTNKRKKTCDVSLFDGQNGGLKGGHIPTKPNIIDIEISTLSEDFARNIRL